MRDRSRVGRIGGEVEIDIAIGGSGGSGGRLLGAGIGGAGSGAARGWARWLRGRSARPDELATPDRTQVRCRVCGFTEVRTDEVIDRGVLLLAACPRCDHRWTAPAPAQGASAVARRRAREVASAA